MIYLKTFGVTLGAAVVLFVIWVATIVFASKTITFGLGIFLIPVLSVWFWLAVFTAGGFYYRLAR
jgi:hypothetical protein